MNLTKENILEHCTIDPDTGCWIWNHCKQYGYGRNRYNGRICRVHRLAWELFKGSIPDGILVCHHCDNRACCNHDHLFLGIQKDNMRDAAQKGRMAAGENNGTHTHPDRVARGEKNGTSKLTGTEVLAIRRRYANGGIFQRTLGEEYGVRRAAIFRIVKGYGWKHV